MIKKFRQEVWKPYHKETWQERFRYSISNYGRVISFVKNPKGELIGGGKSQGFLTFVANLQTGKKQACYIHRVVAELFLKKKEGDKFVIHKNYLKTDNRANNLAWVTKEEWTAHQQGNPQVKENKIKRKIGTIKCYSKLTYAQATILKKKLLDPNRKTRIRVLAKQFGVSEMQLYRIKSGENWGEIKV
ncbi:hypothetical protein GCM10007103_06160 [Salinimicrobium marinum]|uniref:HNH endonuclease n=1 Tax=Salinimicrobium marinum TaxID=680283 RepID=A0A918S6Y7_9FLAO|nr:HNH endonuclease signature motif containing protein [Salinimicrobium marinum]GHA27526.1 hypothetical protein GCM10007103_06160 [Salinimicrobium marinum]